MRTAVASAIEAIRQGDFGPSGDLVDLGAPVIGDLSEYIDDPSDDVRRQVLKLLAAIANPAAFSPLVEMLDDENLDIRADAALAVWDKFDAEDYLASERLPKTLQTSVKLGNESPAALILLGYFPSPQHVSLIREYLADARQPMKLLPGSKPVAPALPAAVALAMMGDDESVQALLQAVESRDLPNRLFLLDVLKDIDSPTVIHALRDALVDERPIASGLPSGAEPSRRVGDLAVERLAQRLNLDLDFKLDTSKRYSPAQIDAVNTAIRSALPQ